MYAWPSGISIICCYPWEPVLFGDKQAFPGPAIRANGRREEGSLGVVDAFWVGRGRLSCSTAVKHKGNKTSATWPKQHRLTLEQYAAQQFDLGRVINEKLFFGSPARSSSSRTEGKNLPHRVKAALSSN